MKDTRKRKRATPSRVVLLQIRDEDTARRAGDAEGTAYTVGCVCTTLSDEQLLDLHRTWREENPEADTDSEFAEWLVGRGYAKTAPIPDTLCLG